MIEDVHVKRLTIHPDDRGRLTEVLRMSKFPDVPPIVQSNFTVAHPGTIKAFHWHQYQWDIWFVATGHVEVCLFDLRTKTYGEKMLLYPGETSPMTIAIPPGVAHGYRVLGSEPSGLLYFVTKEYDPKWPDERREAWDAFHDWKTVAR